MNNSLSIQWVLIISKPLTSINSFQFRRIFIVTLSETFPFLPTNTKPITTVDLSHGLQKSPETIYPQPAKPTINPDQKKRNPFTTWDVIEINIPHKGLLNHTISYKELTLADRKGYRSVNIFASALYCLIYCRTFFMYEDTAGKKCDFYSSVLMLLLNFFFFFNDAMLVGVIHHHLPRGYLSWLGDVLGKSMRTWVRGFVMSVPRGRVMGVGGGFCLDGVWWLFLVLRPS